MSDMERINDEELNNASGGMILNATGIPGECDPSFPWEVIHNEDGHVLGKFSTRAEAEKYAKSFGSYSYNAQEVDFATVSRLRANPNVFPTS